MGSDILMEMFDEVGAIVTGSHIVYAKKEKGWFHGKAYVNKDVISMKPVLLAACAEEMSRQISASGLLQKGIDVVAAPAAGAVSWGGMLARELCRFSMFPQPLSVFAEKAPNPNDPSDHIFTFRKVFQEAIKDRKVLVAEDITNPGTSAKKVANAVEACGGRVSGISVLCNRVGQKAHDYLSPYTLLAVTEVDMQMWHEDECPLCQKGAPLNMSLGKAKDWLATEKGQAWAEAHKK